MVTTDIEYKSSCISYLPPVYAKILEFQQLANVYDKENEKIAKEVERVFGNFFILSLDEYGCKRWESILKIKVNASNTIEDRRFAILTKLLGMRPYTYNKLKELLSGLVGKDNYKLNRDIREKVLSVKLNLAVKNQRRVILELLDNIVPANMIIKVDLLYNTHEILSKDTHEELNSYSHTDLRESEVLKNG